LEGQAARRGYQWRIAVLNGDETVQVATVADIEQFAAAYDEYRCSRRRGRGARHEPALRLAMQFAVKALREVGYLALLLRTNVLELCRNGRMP
jgi:hypothetical protein